MRETIERNNWTAIYQEGKFEIQKARLVLEVNDELIHDDTHRSLPEVFSKPTASLATLKKYRGGEVCQAVVEELLENLVKFANVGRGMNQYQIEAAAKMIFSEFYYLTIADLKLCFRKAIMGEYGQLYDRLDPMMILGWLGKYNEERLSFSATMSEGTHKEKLRAKEESETAIEMPEQIREQFIALAAKWNAPKIELDRPFVYLTLEHYLNSQAPEGSAEKLAEMWGEEYDKGGLLEVDLDRDYFLRFKANELLNKLNRDVELSEEEKKILFGK